MVEVAGCSPLVVERSGSWAGGEGAERPLVQGVGETPVPYVTCDHSVFAA